MAVLLWVCSLAVMGLFLAAWREGRGQAPDRWWSYPALPAFADGAAADPGPLMRPSPRAPLQTGVAILAVALAIDVSAASGIYDIAANQDALAAYAPAGWTVPAIATDGWFV
ncbi:MAG TPA: hypothetical protein VJS38_09735 [Phenylobacterium sp.]|uniref:hypothetical protein n=1 Tax=Phenylobacterium sp. TaxID=1871053 RepID=UPI002B47E16F|nr:hypothetical protein [Phenylobacterium sp.]HKR88445.1 hypothetical protein [Phenylobacterium sp.]